MVAVMAGPEVLEGAAETLGASEARSGAEALGVGSVAEGRRAVEKVEGGSWGGAEGSPVARADAEEQGGPAVRVGTVDAAGTGAHSCSSRGRCR